MRTESEIRQAADLLHWLLTHAEPSAERTDLEHAHAALEWVLKRRLPAGSGPNPFIDALRDLRRIKAQSEAVDAGKGVRVRKSTVLR